MSPVAPARVGRELLWGESLAARLRVLPAEQEAVALRRVGAATHLAFPPLVSAVVVALL